MPEFFNRSGRKARQFRPTAEPCEDRTLLNAAGSIGRDFDGDGKADLATFQPTTGEVSVQGSSGETLSQSFEAGEGVTPIAADFDGDGLLDAGVFYQSSESVPGAAHLKVKL